MASIRGSNPLGQSSNLWGPAICIRPWCTAHVSPVQTSRKIGVQFPCGLAKALTVACYYCLVDTPI